MQAVLVACLFVHYAAALGLFGAALFRRLVPPATQDEAGDAWLRGYLLILALVAVVSAVALLMAESAAMSGAWASAFDTATLGTVLGQTQFGALWLWRLVLALLAVLLAWSTRRRFGRVSLGGAALVASLALQGHPLALGGVWLAINHAVHLLAAGAWLGALPVLAIRVARPGGDPAEATRCLRRFSAYATFAVLVVLASGAINAAVLAGPVGGWLGTPYGQALLAKLALVAVAIALACVNRFLLLPTLGHDSAQAFARLRRSVAVELVVGALIVLAAALLGTLAPPGA